MLSSVEQAFVGRDEKRAFLKTPVWEAKFCIVSCYPLYCSPSEAPVAEVLKERGSTKWQARLTLTCEQLQHSLYGLLKNDAFNEYM